MTIIETCSRTQLRKAGRRKVVLVVDGLKRIHFDVVNPHKFKAEPAHIILTKGHFDDLNEALSCDCMYCSSWGLEKGGEGTRKMCVNKLAVEKWLKKNKGVE